MLNKADTLKYYQEFKSQGLFNIEHFLDVDFEFLLKDIGLKKLEAKRLCRFLRQGHGIDIDTEKVENGKAANERQLNLGIQTKIVVSAGKTICVAQRSPSAPTVLKVKEAWEEFLYPYPKKERMVFYNSSVQPLYEECCGIMPNLRTIYDSSSSFVGIQNDA